MMASQSCWKCLLRPSTGSNISSRTTNIVSSFSTSTPLGKSPINTKKPSTPKSGGQSKTLKLKKRAIVKTGRPPAPGERKALRKRIVLTNNNALEVQELTEMPAELSTADIGRVFALPGSTVDQLRAAEAFKKTQGWGLFRRPSMLVRDKSVELVKMILAAQDSKDTSVTIVDGERGAGKSMMLLQAMATAFMNGWIVLNIPEAQELTMAMTEYAPIADTKPLQYTQNVYTATWLAQIAKANNAVLSEIKLSQQHTLPIPLQSDTSLARLAELGARDPDIAWPVFQAFWSEIISKGRPPVLMALDGLHHIMGDTAYRSSDFNIVHAHDFVIIKHFVDYLASTKQLPNGGAIIAATTTGNNPLSHALDLSIKQKEDGQAGKDVTKIDPYAKIDLRAYNSLQAAGLISLKGLSKIEARGLMEYWAASGVLRQRVDEKTVAEKWALAGNGIIGEIERGALRTMRI